MARPDASVAREGLSGASRLELLAALLIVLSGALYAARYFHAMATTSPWNDEVYSNVFFSAHGPGRVLTFYETNNHVLFNLLSSLLPGRASLDPLRARLWSFAATLALLGGATAFFARRRLFLGAALAFQLLFVHRELLDLLLQARGYALEALFAALAARAALGVLSDGGRRWLVLLAASVVLGTYAIPSFAVFGALVFALLLLATRRREVLLAGTAAAASILVLYAPVLPTLAWEMRMYESYFGRSYLGLPSVAETAALFLAPAPTVPVRPPSALLLSLLVALALGPALVVRKREERSAALVLGGASLLFVGVCLVQQTPPVRTTAFLSVPLLLAAAFALGTIARGRRAHAVLAAAFALVLVPLNVRAARAFAFVPIEDYLGPSRFAAEALPRSLPLHPLVAPYLVEPSLAGRPLARWMDEERFRRGALVVQDFFFTQDPRFDGTRLAPGAVAVRFQQRRGGYQALWLAPPETSGIEALRSDGRLLDLAPLTDRDPATSLRLSEADAASLQVLLPAGRHRSLFVVAAADGVRVEPFLPPPGNVPPPAREGRLTVLPLGDRPPSSLLLRVTGDGSPPALAEVWAYRAD